MIFPERFDVVVVGGGHAGTEAALASARMGRKTLLLTHNIETLGQMSCNPSIGGIGKGHLVKEVDALGGAMAIATDEAGIQFRVLNASKGPAVRATRAQADRVLYKAAIRRRLETQPNLTLFQQAVDDLLVADEEGGPRVKAVVTQIGVTFESDAVVLTTGTFLSGLIHVGLQSYEAGRAGDPPAKRLGARLRDLQLPVGRLKTGTPPRLDGRSLDYSMLEVQRGDEPTPVFSFSGSAEMHPEQRPCWITHTNARTHEIIRAGLDRSPLFTGVIKGVGPRYCPSIEDKVVRFAGPRLAPDLPGTGGARHDRDLSQRHLDLAAIRRAARARALDERVRARPPASARDTRSSTTTSIRGRSSRRWSRRRSPGSSLPGRSMGRPATRRPPPRGCWPD